MSWMEVVMQVAGSGVNDKSPVDSIIEQ